MQQLVLHKSLNRVRNIDTTEYNQVAYERKEKLDHFDRLREEGCSKETAFKVLKISRATYYRWQKNYQDYGLVGLENESRKPNKTRKPTWSKDDESHVLKLRLEFKFWGKYKIAVMYKRRYGKGLSPSIIGRILRKLIDRGFIKSVSFYTGEYHPKPRIFNGHAQRIPRDMRQNQVGDLIQVDHTTATLYTGSSVKHFKAVCPITKFSVEHVYKNATANNATHFLAYAKGRFPFVIRSIQVDGGSEFMADFEAACEKEAIPLYVLPPRSPEQNGCVERGNRTVKAEFYSQYEGPTSLEALNQALHKFSDFYNSVRPHQALQYLTPSEYYASIAGAQSHM